MKSSDELIKDTNTVWLWCNARSKRIFYNSLRFNDLQLTYRTVDMRINRLNSGKLPNFIGVYP